MKFDRETVRAALSIPELMQHFGYEGRAAGAGYRFNSCPACGEGKSLKFCATAEACFCHACGFSGDLFSVLGAIMDLSPDSHFARILSEAASIAGLQADEGVSLTQTRREQRRALREEADRKRALEYDRAERGAARVWYELATTNRQGLEYIESRGIKSDHVAGLCRYTSHSVCLPLWREGQIVNVVGRRWKDGQPKIRGLARCRTRGTFGRPFLNHAHQGPVVIVEGFFDYLSALEMSPTRLVLGAHGCGNLKYVTEVAVGLVRGTGKTILLVGHTDEPGQRAILEARKGAIEAGLPEGDIQEYSLVGGCNDLNDQLQMNYRRCS